MTQRRHHLARQHATQQETEPDGERRAALAQREAQLALGRLGARGEIIVDGMIEAGDGGLVQMIGRQVKTSLSGAANGRSRAASTI